MGRNGAALASRLDEAFELTADDFDRVRTMIHRHAGIALDANKHSMVYSRLARRLRCLGQADFTSYLDALTAQPPGHGEWQEFVNALTTNLTSFWRESHHFPVLAALIRERAAHGPVSLWCCAASTGEEPYTMAITAMQACASRTPPVTILATDIDTAVLTKARAGIYAEDDLAQVDATLHRKHFLRGSGANAGRVRVQSDVRSLVRWQALNLLEKQWPIDARFDAVFCRNVMIYFDAATQRRVLEGLAARLPPGGLLFAGHSENFANARDLFELQGRTVYRRR